MAEPVTVTINRREVSAQPGDLLIKTAQDNGVYIPRFCWHPRMNPVGMCRMCLVEIDTPRGPLMVTSCTTPVSDGMTVDTTNETVKKAQEGVLEFLLINHPLDCPVCDRAGECPLQDQTMAYGPGESRFVEEKRHFEKPIPISELVMLDRERCILCARCTRFSDEVSGDPLIEFQDRGNHTQVNTFPDEPFRSYFSGNTVQICPVGALTATPYRFRARPWDLTAVESTCQHCSSGDRINLQSSQNRLLRILGVDSEPTNQGWLSDKCRFGFEYVASPARLTVPLVRNPQGELEEATWGEALDYAGGTLREIIARSGGRAVAGLGGARSTNEEAYAFSKFLRAAVGTNNVDCQMDDGLDARLLARVVDRARIADLDKAGSILVWGPDLKEEHPTLYLRVRRAAQELGAGLVVIHPRRTGLDDRASVKITYQPGAGGEVLAELMAGKGRMAEAREVLSQGPVVALLGRPGYGEGPDLAEATAAFVRTLADASILPLARRGNVFGALDMGLSPGLFPGRTQRGTLAYQMLADRWGDIPTASGRDCRGILEGLESGEIQAVVLMGADPIRDVPDGDQARRALGNADLVVAIDQFLTDSSGLADVVFPAMGFAEVEGTITNVESRVLKVNRLAPGPGQSREDWAILADLAARLGVDLGLTSAQQISGEVEEVADIYRGVNWEKLDWEERDGIVVGGDLGYVPVYGECDSVSPAPGQMALHYARTMYDDGVMMRESPSLHPLAPGAAAYLHPLDAEGLGVAPGDRVRITSSHGVLEVEAEIDPSLHHRVVYVPFNQPGASSLGSATMVTVRPL
ncbi:MAG: NADH-quinone oxidoreductase subunit NuoG [bacterium]|nr:NADH-quinone oxidoreductase subunit NuoG [Acidimicrobiia bacterium]MCY4649975.1 NADH-quinone oxidoreductase subunit NuoG [bacterium]